MARKSGQESVAAHSGVHSHSNIARMYMNTGRIAQTRTFMFTLIIFFCLVGVLHSSRGRGNTTDNSERRGQDGGWNEDKRGRGKEAIRRGEERRGYE